ncbi:MAG: hypothetical protein KAS62_02990, partial [Candidatus Delongbacteria bacterium]|nr:hypothetical protein [Candidatus Delongbacteria bacterium]
MKRLIALLLIVFAVSTFAGDWYSKAERIDLKPQTTSKDTLWYGYPESSTGWYMREFAERATYYNVDDFGIEYPIILHAVNAGFVEGDYDFTFKVYAKDGVTVLWDSGTITSIDGNNSVGLATPLILTDNFWLSVVPNGSGYPSQFAPDTGQTPSHSYLSDGAGGWINQIKNINGNDVYMENYYDVFL